MEETGNGGPSIAVESQAPRRKGFDFRKRKFYPNNHEITPCQKRAYRAKEGGGRYMNRECRKER